jgi:3-oxoacyl-[acyl-carrier protein] reductase
MPGLLEGKTALITGGSRGIGRALCEVFAREGCDIAFNYNSRPDAAQIVVDNVAALGRRVQAYQISVTDRPGVKGMVRDIIEKFGRIDILVNNAAINRADMFLTMKEEAWDEVVNTNLNGLYNVTKPVFRQMVHQRGGKILNISSIGGVRTVPTSVHYATTKSAVVGFTKMLAREGGSFGVVVNGIAAGIFDTDLGHTLPDKFKEIYEMWCSAGRLGRPEELGEIAAFLVSDRNSYMSGEMIIVDGGTIT